MITKRSSLFLITIFIFLGLLLGCQSPPTETKEKASGGTPKQADKDKVEKQPKAKLARGEQHRQVGLQEEEKKQVGKEEKGGEKESTSSEEQKAQDILKSKEEKDRLEQEQTKIYVDNLIKTAEQKIAQNQYNAAKTYLDQALEKDPTNEKAQKLRSQVGVYLGEQEPAYKGISGLEEEAYKVKIQQAKVEVQNHYNKGLQHFEAKEYEQAIREFEAALEIIKWAPYQLNMERVEKQSQEMIRRAQTQKTVWEKQQKEEQFRKAKEEAEKLEAEEQAKQSAQIKILLSRAVEYFAQREFDKAEMLTDEVLTIDPGNKVAKKLALDAQEARHNKSVSTNLRDKIEGWKKVLEQIQDAEVPWSNLLIFPEKGFWHGVVNKRGERGLGGEATKEEQTPAVQAIKSKLETMKITLNFSEAPFKDVIRFIQTVSDINIVLDPKVERNFVSQGTKVTLNVDNLQLKSALNILMQLHNLIYTFKEDVLFITNYDSELAKGEAIPRLHDIRDLTGKLRDFPGPRIKLSASKGGEDIGQGVVFEESPVKQQPLTTETLQELIKASIAKDTWTTGNYSIAETGGQLLVVHTPEVQTEISKFLNDMRRFSGMLVTVEARFIRCFDDFLESVGVDLRGLGETTDGVDTGGNAVKLSPTIHTIPSGVMSAGHDSAAPRAASGVFFRDGNVDHRLRTEHMFDTALGSRLSEAGGLSLQLAYLDDVQMELILRMVRKTHRAEILSAPRLTAFNTQRANVTIVNQVTYVRDFDVEVAQSAYIADPIIGTVQEGLVLDVRPTISNDRKYITLELRPTLANIISMDPFTTTLGQGQAVQFQIPKLEVDSVETTVRVPDGGLILIGGLKKALRQDRKGEIPLLSNIPILSFFFNYKGTAKERDNLVVAVKAQIIDLQEQEERQVGLTR